MKWHGSGFDERIVVAMYHLEKRVNVRLQIEP